MSYCILLLTHLIAFQGVDFCICTGKVHSTCKDSPYQNSLMMGISRAWLFKDNLAGSLQYTRIWLKPKTLSEPKSITSDEIYGVLRAIKPVVDFADLYAFGGGGLWFNPQHKMKFSIYYGLGAKKAISSSISLELNFRVNCVLDETESLRNWRSFYGGIRLHFSGKSTTSFVPTEDEVEVIARYLAPKLRKSRGFESDEEMEKFVREFWKANDPIPHTPENELREEVLSRIDYANKWFRGVKEGWKTDRGRIWIIFGEPDEIIREERWFHFAECWLYYRIYKHITPIVFVFQEYASVYRQVFSNVTGEFGHNAKVELINPSIDRYTRFRWYTPEENP